MKNNSLKKAVAIALCASLSTAVLAGCGGKSSSSQSTESNPASSGSQAAADDSDQVSDKVSLTIGMQNHPFIEDLETNWFTTYLEENMNVDLTFSLLPTDGNEANTKLNLMISSGETLPDIINMRLSSLSVDEYGAKGVLVNLSPYFADEAKMPNYYKYVPAEDREYIEKCVRSADGNLYTIPLYSEYGWNEACYRCFINLDWVEKAEVSIPTTTDEFYDVLKTFASTDLNGNGKQDEVGMAGGGGWAQNPIPYLMNAFLYANPAQGYFDVQDGKIIASFTQPEWRDGLEYINKLCTEGLLSPLSFTQDQVQLKSLINVEGGMVGVVPAGSYSTFDTTIVGEPNHGGGYKLMAPLKGPDGHVSTPQSPSQATGIWYITKDCQNVDEAVLLGDYFMDSQVCIMSSHGEKGVDWTDDPEVMKDYYMNPAEEAAGYTFQYVEINTLWKQVQNKNWQDAQPGYSITPPKSCVGNVRKDSEAGQSGGIYSAIPDFEKMYAPVFRPTDELIVRLNYTEEENQRLADIKTTIDQYVSEQTVAFITGKRPLSDWDNYLKELENMQLQTYIDINQAAYDRF